MQSIEDEEDYRIIGRLNVNCLQVVSLHNKGFFCSFK